MTPDEATRQVLTKALLATYTYAGKPDRARMIADAILATEPGSRLTTTDHPDVRAGLERLRVASVALADHYQSVRDTWGKDGCWAAFFAAVDAYRAALSATSEPKRQPECWCGADGIDRDHEGARLDIVCPRHDP
jgi:hypothetical protein